MDEKEKEIAALRAIYDEEKKELTRLEDYFNQVRGRGVTVTVTLTITVTLTVTLTLTLTLTTSTSS